MKENRIKPAIIVLGYNRVDSINRLLSSIKSAYYEVDDITLIISLDKSSIEKTLVEVAEAFEWVHGEKIIRTFDERQGLKKHVLSCGDLTEKYGAVIVLEDDLLVSDNFYNYVYDALEYYKDEKEIAGIALYSHKFNGYSQNIFEPLRSAYDTYLGQFGVSWGQCWTREQWRGFKKWYDTSPQLTPIKDLPYEVLAWDDKSWNKYFCYYTVLNNKYYVMPYDAHSTCFSEVGEHAERTSSTYQVPLAYGEKKYRFAPIGKAVKYDMFFEYQFSNNDKICNIDVADICIDINHHKRDIENKKYLLTTGRCGYEIIKEYSLEMKPAEQNVISGLDGKGIYLYKLPDNCTAIEYIKKDSTVEKLYFDLETIPWKKAFRYSVIEIRNRIRERALKK